MVAIFSQQMLSGGEVNQPIINGSGEQERDFVYVADYARANLLVLDRGDRAIYNLGSGVGTSINRLFHLMKDTSGYQGPERHGPAKPGEVFKVYLDSSKARTELGWEPEISLEEGVRMTVDYFRVGGQAR